MAKVSKKEDKIKVLTVESLRTEKKRAGCPSGSGSSGGGGKTGGKTGEGGAVAKPGM